MNTPTGIERKESIAGLAKGLAIIEMFGAGTEMLTVADAARGTGITRAAARRCLLTLTELGYLSHDGKHFTPTAKLRRLGGGALDRVMLAERVQPILEELRSRLQESVSWVVLDGRDALFMARAEAERIISTGVRLGGRMPAYAVAAGRLLLGTLPDEEIRAYLDGVTIERRTPRSVIDRDRLFDIIVTARERGYCYNDEELELGMRALAVAVSVNGLTVGAISLSTLTLRMSLEEMDERCRPLLEAAASRLSTLPYSRLSAG